MEDVATAKKLKAYGKKKGLKYGCLKKNYLINSTRKFDDMGDWLYFKLMVKAVKGGRKGWDKLVDEMFYEYNDRREAQGYYGIEECGLIKAVGLDIVGADVEGIMREAENQI